MTSEQIAAALSELNSATGRGYTVTEHNGAYVLTIPSGGEYPAAQEGAMVARLVQLRIAAEGRPALTIRRNSGS